MGRQSTIIGNAVHSVITDGLFDWSDIFPAYRGPKDERPPRESVSTRALSGVEGVPADAFYEASLAFRALGEKLRQMKGSENANNW